MEGSDKEAKNGNQVNCDHDQIKAFVGLNVKSICPSASRYGIMRHERNFKI